MTDEDKVKKYDAIAEWLWAAAMHGNLLQSSLAANLIRHLEIPSPDGDDPEEA